MARAPSNLVRAQQIPAPKSSLFSTSFQIPMKLIEMSTHLLPKQGRTHNKRKQTLQVLSLRENRRRTIICRLNMEFMVTSNREDGRALPREQGLGVFLSQSACLRISSSQTSELTLTSATNLKLSMFTSILSPEARSCGALPSWVLISFSHSVCHSG